MEVEEGEEGEEGEVAEPKEEEVEDAEQEDEDAEQEDEDVEQQDEDVEEDDERKAAWRRWHMEVISLPVGSEEAAGSEQGRRGEQMGPASAGEVCEPVASAIVSFEAIEAESSPPCADAVSEPVASIESFPPIAGEAVEPDAGLGIGLGQEESHDSIPSIDPAMERSMDAEMPGEAPSSSAVAPSSSSALCGREVEPAPTTSRSVGPRLHATPKTVKDIEPNWMFHCRINKNDHRFQVSMDKKADKHETWIDVYAQKYFSAGFQAHGGWRQALQEAHSWMWTKWELANMPLPEGKVRQKPGKCQKMSLPTSKVNWIHFLQKNV